MQGDTLEPARISTGWIQVLIYLVGVGRIALFYVLRTQGPRSLLQDSVRFSRMSAYIIRFAFWSVTLIGFVDMLISFLRVEGLLEVGRWRMVDGQQFGRPIFRGTYVHYPLLLVMPLSSRHACHGSALFGLRFILRAG